VLKEIVAYTKQSKSQIFTEPHIIKYIKIISNQLTNKVDEPKTNLDLISSNMLIQNYVILWFYPGKKKGRAATWFKGGLFSLKKIFWLHFLFPVFWSSYKNGGNKNENDKNNCFHCFQYKLRKKWNKVKQKIKKNKVFSQTIQP